MSGALEEARAQFLKTFYIFYSTWNFPFKVQHGL